MAKTLYSLMLNDDLVREVDRLAHTMGNTRSGMINNILAEYLGVLTPERRINEILTAVEQLLAPTQELVPFLAPGALSLSLKSSLEYKYRPTVKYEVQLYRGGGDALGELDVVFRTQSAGLLAAMTDFFRVWKAVEDSVLPAAGVKIDYALYDGKFTRSIAVPRQDADSKTLARTISAYVQLFDRCMKNYLSGRYDAQTIRAAYLEQLKETQVVL